MNTLTIQQLFDAGVHYGHLSKKWNPSFKPFIFMKKGAYHLIDVKKTLVQLQEAGEALKAILAKGGKVLFVGCKKQASPVVTAVAEALQQPYVTKRWLGGTLTNFATFRKRLKQLAMAKTTGEAPKESKRYLNLTKKERLIEDRTKKKQASLLGGMTILKRLPSALFVVDINLECTAVREAKKLGLPIFAIVDSNASPDPIDYPIACNDDKRSAIKLVLDYLAEKMAEGNELWAAEKANRDSTRAKAEETEKQAPSSTGRKRVSQIQSPKTTTSSARKQASDKATESEKVKKVATAKAAETKPAAKDAAKTTTKATAAKEAKAAPKATATKPAAKDAAKTTTKATTAKETKAAPKATEVKPAAKDAAKTTTKATAAKETKAAPKATEVKPAAKDAAKTTTKATAAKETKAAPKATATKPAAKEAAKATTKATAAKETKAAPKATATKPAAKEAAKTTTKATAAKETKAAPKAKATATKPAAKEAAKTTK